MRTAAALPCLVALLLCLAGSVRAQDEAPPESRAWQRLKRMDTDGDGKVSRKEFVGPERLWTRMDADGDGVVTRKEADAAGGRPGGERGGRGGLLPGAGGLAFAQLDLDKDGTVSQREWAAFLEKADENKDAVLQKEEWDAALGGGPLHDAAPRVGSPAPKVSATMIHVPLEVDLSRPKRTTVLIFGSWT